LVLLHAVRVVDGVLFNIPLEQEEAPLQFTCGKGVRIDDLSDTAALKMTRFKLSHLRRLYALSWECWRYVGDISATCW
jgi:hypothetical protein